MWSILLWAGRERVSKVHIACKGADCTRLITGTVILQAISRTQKFVTINVTRHIVKTIVSVTVISTELTVIASWKMLIIFL